MAPIEIMEELQEGRHDDMLLTSMNNDRNRVSLQPVKYFRLRDRPAWLFVDSLADSSYKRRTLSK